MRYMLLILAISLLLGGAASAQSGGQFCVRAFEDRNGNGQIDPGEPFLTRGVSANLLNADGVIVASALLDNSPTAAQGVICFQFLEAAQYTLEVSSADFSATTPVSFTASISGGTLPTVVEYGGQRIVDEPAAEAAPADVVLDLETDMLPRLVLAGLGALIVIAGMVMLGALVYLMFFRSRRPARPYYVPPTTGGLAEPVTLDDDIPDMPVRPLAPTPTPGEQPPVRDEADEDKRD